MSDPISYERPAPPSGDDLDILMMVANTHLGFALLIILSSTIAVISNWSDLKIRLGMLGFGVFGLLWASSGYCMRKRKQRVFSIAVAGLMVLAFPIGTILGIGTIVTLSRAGIIRIYAQ